MSRARIHVPAGWAAGSTSPAAFLDWEVPGWPLKERGKHLQGLTLQAALPFLLLPPSQISLPPPAIHPSM